MNSTKVFILCGGEGTRLRPYTLTKPKPMLPIANKPIVQYVIENLKKNGLVDLILTIGYLKEKIIDYFKDGKNIGLNIEYLIEDEPKMTAGSILPKKNEIKDTFVVIMGDTMNDIDVREMIAQHKKNKVIATMCVINHKTQVEYGVVDVKDGIVEKFIEKPVIEHYINAGTYVFEPEIFNYIKDKEDFAKNVFPRILKSGKEIHVYVHNGKWQDIGRVSDYERLKEEMETS